MPDEKHSQGSPPRHPDFGPSAKPPEPESVYITEGRCPGLRRPSIFRRAWDRITGRRYRREQDLIWRELSWLIEHVAEYVGERAMREVEDESRRREDRAARAKAHAAGEDMPDIPRPISARQGRNGPPPDRRGLSGLQKPTPSAPAPSESAPSLDPADERMKHARAAGDLARSLDPAGDCHHIPAAAYPDGTIARDRAGNTYRADRNMWVLKEAVDPDYLNSSEIGELRPSIIGVVVKLPCDSDDLAAALEKHCEDLRRENKSLREQIADPAPPLNADDGQSLDYEKHYQLVCDERDMLRDENDALMKAARDPGGSKHEAGQWLWTDGECNHSSPGAVLLISRDKGIWRCLIWSVYESGFAVGTGGPTHLPDDALDQFRPYYGAEVRDGRLYFRSPEDEPGSAPINFPQSSPQSPGSSPQPTDPKTPPTGGSAVQDAWRDVKQATASANRTMQMLKGQLDRITSGLSPREGHRPSTSPDLPEHPIANPAAKGAGSGAFGGNDWREADARAKSDSDLTTSDLPTSDLWSNEAHRDGWADPKAAEADDISHPPAESGESILETAQRITRGDRHRDYGHPFDEHGQIARLWSALTGHEFTAEQVAECMILLKLARNQVRRKRDNQVDTAGYAECLQRIIEERKRRENRETSE